MNYAKCTQDARANGRANCTHTQNLHEEHHRATKYEPGNIEIAFRAVEIRLQRCGVACDEILQANFL